MSSRLAAGDKAPDFTLPDADGNQVSLADLAGGRVVLYFFPWAFTPGCTTQACDFRDQWPHFSEQGVTVVGISRDTPEVLGEFAREHKLGFLLLSDVERSVHAAYGVLGTIQVEGMPKEKVTRSTFVLGADGTIESAQYAVDVAGHVTSLLRAAEAAPSA